VTRVARFFWAQHSKYISNELKNIPNDLRNIPNGNKIHQMAIKYTKWPQNYQMTIKYTPIYHSKAFQKFPEWDFW
jgi:hypothetical protein